MNREIKSLLSLCQKSGKILSGELSCEKALQSNSAKLIIIAEDASQNTKDKFINKAFFYKVPAVVFSQKQELSGAIGRENRAVFAVCDDGFARSVKEKIESTFKTLEVGECHEYTKLQKN